MVKSEVLEGMKIDNIMPQVNRSVFPDGHGVISVTSGRIRQIGMTFASSPSRPMCETASSTSGRARRVDCCCVWNDNHGVQQNGRRIHSRWSLRCACFIMEKERTQCTDLRGFLRNTIPPYWNASITALDSSSQSLLSQFRSRIRTATNEKDARHLHLSALFIIML